MSHVLKGYDLPADFLLAQFFPRDMFIFQVIRTVGAPVHTVVGEIEWGEKYNTVSVKIFFDLFCQPEDLFV